MLARKFSAVWIAENANDLLAQANIEYAEWLETNPPARNPVGWLLNGAYWRALNLLESESRKPPTASLDTVFHLADESTPTPERQALDKERQTRLRDALGHLPEKERRLLSHVYFEGMSIREAGRKLGWQKSAADRHHSAAMKKMLALVGDRSLLSPATLGPVAWASISGEGQRSLRAAWDAAIEAGAHRLGELGRRLSPFTEPGNAAAAGGAGRVAGYCGVAAGAVACGLFGSGVVGPGAGALLPNSSKPQKPRAVEARPASSPAPATTRTPPAPERVAPKRSERPDAADATEPTQPAARRARDPRFRFPRASGKQSRNEFGDNNFIPGSAPEAPPPSEPLGEPSPSPEPAPSPASPGSQSSGSSAASEFGL